jgi:uncharacterized protein YeaC (DUF1315 family)
MFIIVYVDIDMIHQYVLFNSCVSMFTCRAIYTSVIHACKIGRFPDPQVLSAAMQELSIRKQIAIDMKKNVIKRKNKTTMARVFLVCFSLVVECT